MKVFPLVSALFLLSGPLNAVGAAPARTMHDLPGVPVTILKHELSKEDYALLSRTPVKAYLVVRGQVIGSVVRGTRIIRSEGNGVYDKAALQLASGMTLYTSAAGTNVPQTALVYILIYQAPKGEKALVVAQDDSAGETNLLYSRTIRIFDLGLKGGTDRGSKPKKN